MPQRRTRHTFSDTLAQAPATSTVPDEDRSTATSADKHRRRRKRRDMTLAFDAAHNSDRVDQETETPEPSTSGRDKSKRTLTLSRLKQRVSRQAPEALLVSHDAQQATAELVAATETKDYALNDPRRYIGPDKHMRICKKDWRELNREYAGKSRRNALVSLLNKVITSTDMEPPLRMLEREDSLVSFRALQALNNDDLFETGRTKARFNYQATLGQVIIKPNDTGNLTSDYFFQDIRWTCKGGRRGSPSESWYDERSRRAVLHHMIDADVPYVDRHRLRKHLGTRYYIPTPYRPSTAKALFDLLQPESVLDMSFGWGDRLVGFEASKHTKQYFGIDPDKRVLEQGRKLHKLCRQTRKTVELYHSPAEDFAYEIMEPVDMLYFAPPPFNTERYTEEETQAYKRYTDVNSFVENFLVQSITKAWSVLKPGGTLSIDLGDLRAPLRDRDGNETGGRYYLVDELMRHLHQKLNQAVFRGSIGTCVGHKVPDNTHDATRVDPIWIITKGHCAMARKVLFGRKRAGKLNERAGL